MLISLPSLLCAQVQIVAILPNTVDDKNLEYVEVRNTGCEMMDLSNYTLEDALPKAYTVPSGTILTSHTNYQFIRPVTKLELNNTNETVRLRDTTMNIVSEYSYATSTKGEVIILSGIQDQDCTVSDTQTGATSDSGTLLESGSTLPEIPLDTQAGTTENDIFSLEILTESLSGDILTDLSGSIGTATGDISADTGVTSIPFPSSTGASFVLTGEILPVSLSYDDIDLDGAIDTLYVEYDSALSGSLIPENIYLYSNTGGLYITGALTQTGYILGGTFSGNILILSIRESDYQKNLLSISNTTRSDLRLKNSADLGIRGADGRSLAKFLLTSSFDNYTHVSSRIVTIDPISNTSGSLVSASSTGAVFPEISPTIQNYTNARYESGAFFCTEMLCRINLNFEPVFTGSMRMGNYICHVVFGTGEYQSCNPPQFTFSQSGIIEFILTDKATNIEQSYQYEVFYTPTIQGSTTQGIIAGIVDTTPPVIVVEMDGKWKEYFESVGDTELDCYSFTCGINLTAERSYDPEGGKIRYIWLYDGANPSESKDPGTRYFTIGDHDIWLRVIDSAGNVTHLHYTLHVYPPKEKSSLEEKKTKKGTSKTASSVQAPQKMKKKKKLKKLKMDFFDTPEWNIQNSGSLLRKGKSIFCETKKKYCSINLALTNPEKGIIYTWIYPDGTEMISKNPRSFRFNIGQGEVRLLATNQEGGILSEDTLSIHVKKIITPKKKKKTLIRKSTNTRIPIQNTYSHIDNSSGMLRFGSISASVFIFVFLSLLGTYLLLFRKRIYSFFLPVE